MLASSSNSVSKAGPQDNRYSVLQISGQYFCVEVLSVREVLPMPGITRVPNIDRSIAGVFNLRGEIHTLIDLRRLLHMAAERISPKNMVVLLEQDRQTLGIVVDKVLDVLTLDTGKIHVPTRELSPSYIEFINGQYQHKKLGNLFILDVPSLFAARILNQYRYF